MIKTENLSKAFEDKMVLKGVKMQINDGSICGLVGSNGAGKSTLIRCISGVYTPDEGKVNFEGKRPDKDASVREDIFYLADEAYFAEGSSLKSMARFYASYYPSYDMKYFEHLCESFHLDAKSKISGFSKGMRRQAALILALAARTKYLLLDESFDGLDPVVRKAVRKLICREVADKNITVLISSHSLRELEDLCDQLLFLHDGRLLLDQRTDDLKIRLLKVQVAFEGDYDKSIFEGFEIVKYEKSGSVSSLIVRGSEEHIRKQIAKKKPLLLEILPLSLEEVFTCEAESLGYTFDLEEGEEDE